MNSSYIGVHARTHARTQKNEQSFQFRTGKAKNNK